MDLNSPLFDRIRIKPDRDEPAREAGPGCERTGCAAPGLHRAPKGRGQEGQYWCFCLDHVREYNKGYNYFAGMPDEAVMDYQKDASPSGIGRRGTWVSTRASAAASDGGPDRRASSTTSTLSASCVFVASRPEQRSATARARTTSPAWTSDASALETLDLPEGRQTDPAIKTQFKVLVKRFHPDAHGGDKSYEERLRDIIRAHDTLKAAGLC